MMKKKEQTFTTNDSLTAFTVMSKRHHLKKFSISKDQRLSNQYLKIFTKFVELNEHDFLVKLVIITS